METEYSASKSKQDWNARWWLNESEGQVNIVKVTSIQRQRREYLFQRWALVDKIPAVTYEIVLSRSVPDEPIEVSSTDKQLILRFEDVFAQQLDEGEQDITMTLDDVKSVAQDVWHFDFGDPFEELE
jgi:hypothetical protein